MNLGEKIKKYRKLFKLTQEELAAKLEISKHTLSKYEQNQRKPNIEMLNKIAKALDVTVNDLMEFEELKKEVTNIEYIDLSNVPTNLLIEELNKRDDFQIKLEVK